VRVRGGGREKRRKKEVKSKELRKRI